MENGSDPVVVCQVGREGGREGGEGRGGRKGVALMFLVRFW